MVCLEAADGKEHCACHKARSLLYLANELHSHNARQSTHLRQAITIEQKVSVTIQKLDNSIEYRMLAKVFGIYIGRSTVYEILNNTVL